jgi:hypothetical protein
MLSRVVRPGTTTYIADYTPKQGQRVFTRNLSTAVTTGCSYLATRRSLYSTDIHDTAEGASYVRPRSFRMDLLELPPEYRSSARPDLAPQTGLTDYRHYFGRLGESATVKRSVIKPRSLSKATRAFVHGTTRSTHHPPRYDAHIPSEWPGNRGKDTHTDRNLQDATWQYHVQKTGYCGYVPTGDMTGNTTGLKRTGTTYRDMCDEIGFTVDD